MTNTHTVEGTTRNRQLLRGILTSAASRALAVISPLVTTPVTLHYFGEELFGAWMALISLTAMAAFADLGLGFGLMTRLAPALAHGDQNAARTLTSSAYTVLCGFSTVLVLTLIAVNPWIPWAAALNVETPYLVQQVEGIAFWVILSFIVSIPLSLVTRVQYAHKMVGQSNAWQAAGSLLSVASVYLFVSLGLSPVAVAAAAAFAIPIGYALNTAWLFGRRLRTTRPRLQSANSTMGFSLVKLGGGFFVLTATISACTNSDSLVIAHALDLSAVSQYAAVNRIFGTLGVLVSLINVPLWPMVGEALAKGDRQWVRRATTRMSILSFSTVVLPGIVLTLMGPALVDAWLSKPLYFTTLLAVGFVLWWAIQAGTSPRFMVQNSQEVLAPQMLGWGLFALISLPLKYIACQHYGIAAVPLVGAMVYAVTVLPSALIGYRKALET